MTSGEGMPGTLEADHTAHFLLVSPLGLLSIVPMPGPLLSFHLGRATGRHWAWSLPQRPGWMTARSRRGLGLCG